MNRLEVTVKRACPMCKFGMRFVGYWKCLRCGFHEFGGCCGD